MIRLFQKSDSFAFFQVVMSEKLINLRCKRNVVVEVVLRGMAHNRVFLTRKCIGVPGESGK